MMVLTESHEPTPPHLLCSPPAILTLLLHTRIFSLCHQYSGELRTDLPSGLE